MCTAERKASQQLFKLPTNEKVTCLYVQYVPCNSNHIVKRDLRMGFKNPSLADSLLSPPGDLEMDLSGDIPSQSIPIHPRHIGLSVQNCAKLFNSDQTR